MKETQNIGRRSASKRTAASAIACMLLGISAEGATAADEKPNPAIREIQDSWYHAVTSALGLDTSTFQLVQTTDELDLSTNGPLWHLMDALPPQSTVHEHDHEKADECFFHRYDDLLAKMVKPKAGGIEPHLSKDEFKQWQTYLKKNATKVDTATDPAAAEVELFGKWCQIFLDLSKARTVVNKVKQANNHPLALASTALKAHAPEAKKRPSYDTTAADVIARLKTGSDVSFTMQVDESTNDIDETWAGSNSAVLGFFRGGEEVERINQKITTKGFRIEAKFKGVVTVPVNHGKWYNSAALSIAQGAEGKAGVFTAEGKKTWEEHFGDAGKLRNITTALHLARNWQANITCRIDDLTAAERKALTAAGVTIWPFYGAADKTTTKIEFGADGELRITMQSDNQLTGANPAAVVIGVDVMPIEKALGK